MERERKVLHAVAGACPICGLETMALIESRPRPTGWARLDPRVRHRTHTYPRCESCGARPRRSS